MTNSLLVFSKSISPEQHNQHSHFLSFEPSLLLKRKFKELNLVDTTEYIGPFEHQNIAQHSQQLIELLESIPSYKDDFGVEQAYRKTFIFESQFMIYHVLYCLTLLAKVAEKNNITQVTIDSADSFGSFGSIIIDGLSAYCEINNIKFNCKKSKKQLNPLFKLVAYKNFLLALIEKTLFYLSMVTFRVKLFLMGAKSFFIVNDDSYNSSNLEPFLYDIHGVYPVYLQTSASQIIKKLSYLFSLKRHCLFIPVRCLSWNSISHSKFHAADFNLSYIWNEIDLMHIMQGQITASRDDSIAQLSSMIKDLMFFFGSEVPKMIFSQQGHGIASAIGELGRSMGIKTIFLSHGSHIYTNNDDANQLWRQHSKSLLDSGFEYTLIQSVFEEEFIHQHKLSLEKLIYSGPIIKCQHLSPTTEQSGATINPSKVNTINFLYASTPKFGIGFRPIIYETYDEYFKNLELTLESLSSDDESFLTIRHRDTKHLHSSNIKEKFINYSNCNVSNKGSFLSAISSSDCLISYSSTCIEEAIMLGKQVIIIDFQNKYNHLGGIKNQYKTIPSNQNNYIEFNQVSSHTPIYYYVTNQVEFLQALESIKDVKKLDEIRHPNQFFRGDISGIETLL